MVLVGLIVAVALALFIVQFGGTVGAGIADRLKTPEQRAIEERERKRLQSEAEERASKGALANTFDFIFGEEFSRGLKEKQQVEAADQQLELQAQQAGFKDRADAEQQLDAGSVVIGSSRNTVDFGLIGDVVPTDPSEEFLQTFGGQSKIGRKRFGQ